MLRCPAPSGGVSRGEMERIGTVGLTLKLYTRGMTQDFCPCS